MNVYFITHLEYLMIFINHTFQVESESELLLLLTQKFVSVTLCAQYVKYGKKLNVELKSFLNQTNLAVKL